MKRHLALALLIATLVTGCVDSHVGVSDATYTRTSADLVRQLKALPGLTVDTHVESSFETGRGNVFADVAVPVASTVAQIDAVVDTIERTVWLSHLDPLGSISINVTRRGSSASVRQRLYEGRANRWRSTGPDPTACPTDRFGRGRKSLAGTCGFQAGRRQFSSRASLASCRVFDVSPYASWPGRTGVSPSDLPEAPLETGAHPLLALGSTEQRCALCRHWMFCYGFV
jgi:hypothetical protein